MTDRELLKWAAKAAGYITNHPWNKERMTWTPPVLALVAHCDGKLVSTGWNPLDHDADALRLAVRLGLCVTIFTKDHDTIVGYPKGEHDGANIIEPHNNDPFAATRRAIVRAAAAIGQAMPSGKSP
jgi:hypothetical protein